MSEKQPHTIVTLLERAQEIERYGTNILRVSERLGARQQLNHIFELILKNPGKAYVHLMRASLNQTGEGKTHDARTALLGRLCGYALVAAIADDEFFKMLTETEKQEQQNKTEVQNDVQDTTN